MQQGLAFYIAYICFIAYQKVTKISYFSQGETLFAVPCTLGTGIKWDLNPQPFG